MIPDFLNPVDTSVPFDTTGYEHLVYKPFKNYQASRDSNCLLPENQPRGKLIVRGKLLGTIRRREAMPTGPRPQKPNDDFQFHFLEICHKWSRIALSIARCPATGEDLLTVLNKTLLFYLPPNRDRRRDIFRSWFAVMLCPELDTIHDEVNQETTALSPNIHPAVAIRRSLATMAKENKTLVDEMGLLQAGIMNVAYYALCLLDSGYLGMAFRHCQEGDQVFFWRVATGFES